MENATAQFVNIRAVAWKLPVRKGGGINGGGASAAEWRRIRPLEFSGILVGLSVFCRTPSSIVMVGSCGWYGRDASGQLNVSVSD